MFQAVLFDLDGTLIDTAKDMARSLNQLLEEEGQPRLDYELIRSKVSAGARALITLAFGELRDDEHLKRLHQRFLEIYTENIHIETTLFPEMDRILKTLEENNIPWGIVTNKPSWLTLPLLKSMQLEDRATTIVCPDSAGASKPDAKPMIDACKKTCVEPEYTVYIGDDERDVIAAHNAGMSCIVLRSGYIQHGHDPEDWGAEIVMDSTTKLREWMTQQIEAATI